MNRAWITLILWPRPQPLWIIRESFLMSSSGDTQKTVLRNMLLGRWAASQLGMGKAETKAYCDTLANAALVPDERDVFTKIRKDFDAAGLPLSDEQILRVMTELMIKAGEHMPGAPRGSVDAAAVMLKSKLSS